MDLSTPLGVECSLSLQLTPLETPSIASLSLIPSASFRPLTSHSAPVKHRWTTCAACFPHIVLDSSWLNTVYSEFWLSGFSVSSPIKRSQSARVAGSSLTHSTAALNARLERPTAIWQPALLMHSCISL